MMSSLLPVPVSALYRYSRCRRVPTSVDRYQYICLGLPGTVQCAVSLHKKSESIMTTGETLLLPVYAYTAARCWQNWTSELAALE